ncbi:dihydrolipoyl dehydrogenase family protein [Furfurilactobacillus sp. WILCCON 0119]|uniref:dihydrolipoyl dehydrogenase family protein n=1 Tax=Furfurilactobacillus entadae TaxID=2922307 RepID=UPI0035E7F684
MTSFDQLVIGGGPGGLALAEGLASAGQQVAIVEENLWGGTCPNRGCDPKKILLAAVEAKRAAEQMAGHGLTGVPTINWTDLMAKKTAYTSTVPTGTLAGLQQSGATTLNGHAQFNADGTVQVGTETVSAKTITLATGQRPARLTIPGADHIQTSTDFLNWQTLPNRVTFIGGGYIAFELADIANAAGADVHVVLHNDRPLRAFDADLADDLVAQLTAAGVHFDMNIAVEAVTATDDGLTLTAADGFELTTDAIVGATGRIPNVDTLNLDAVGVEANRHGVVVNDHLQTTNPQIYALGDVVAKRDEPKLTPVAGFDARYLVGELTGATTAPISYPAIPTVVFGAPKLAAVGVAIPTAQADDTLRVTTLDMTHWYTYQRIEEATAQAKVVTNAQGQIVGATVLSNLADEMINYLTLVVNKHLTLDDVIMAYPTPASDLVYL